MGKENIGKNNINITLGYMERVVRKLSKSAQALLNFFIMIAISKQSNSIKINDSYVTNGKGLGWSRRTVLRARQELEDKGFIERKGMYIVLKGIENPHFREKKNKKNTFKPISNNGKNILKQKYRPKYEGYLIRFLEEYQNRKLDPNNRNDMELFITLEELIGGMIRGKDERMSTYLKIWKENIDDFEQFYIENIWI